AVNQFEREWRSRVDHNHYVLRYVMGPHPYPTMVRYFQSVISREIKDEFQETHGQLPDAVIACVGGGSNAIGTFYHFIEDEGVRLIGCEAAGKGIHTTPHAATMAKGTKGSSHGMER